VTTLKCCKFRAKGKAISWEARCPAVRRNYKVSIWISGKSTAFDFVRYQQSRKKSGDRAGKKGQKEIRVQKALCPQLQPAGRVGDREKGATACDPIPRGTGQPVHQEEGGQTETTGDKRRECYKKANAPSAGTETKRREKRENPFPMEAGLIKKTASKRGAREMRMFS